MIHALRFSKGLLVAAVALTASLVAFNNLADYQTNRLFVAHVLAMDTIFKDSAIHGRAITDSALQALCYWLIIVAEAATAVLCWVGAFALLRALTAPAPMFSRARKWCIAGLTLGFVTWQVGFLAIGGEWFGMWQSAAWNGEQSAFRFYMTIIAVLIYVSLPDPVA